MKFQELKELIRNGYKPVVTFCKGIDDCEAYPERGMRGRIIQVRQNEDDVIILRFDFDEFSEFNIPFESANYFDKSGKPTLNARQAGYYKPQEDIYFDSSDSTESKFTLDKDRRLELHSEYIKSGSSLSYINYIEDLVLQSRDVLSEDEAEGPIQHSARAQLAAK